MSPRIDARIGTALVLMPLALGITLYGTQALFAGFCAVVTLIGAWEWTGIAAPRRWYWELAGLLLTALLLATCYVLLIAHYYNSSHVVAFYIMGLSLIWWGAALVLIMLRQSGREFSPGVLAQAVMGALTLVPAWVALVALHIQPAWRGPELVVCLFALVWCADTGAYYTGKRWGRRKLAPHVSPGKTLEGLGGAFAGGLAAALLCALLLLQMGLPELAPFLLVCMATIAMSVLGDLTESMIKRSAGVKDSGELLPGHGGALDRIDSLTAAAPAFYVGMLLLERGQ